MICLTGEEGRGAERPDESRPHCSLPPQAAGHASDRGRSSQTHTSHTHTHSVISVLIGEGIET